MSSPISISPRRSGFTKSGRPKATIVLTHAKNPLQFGVVITDQTTRITRFLEKPSWGEVFSDTINTGIYILEPEVLEMIPYREDYDFSKDLFPLLLRQDLDLYGYVADGYWRDIGNLNEYQEAHIDVLNGLVKVELEGTEEGGVRVGANTSVDRSKVHCSGNVVIGSAMHHRRRREAVEHGHRQQLLDRRRRGDHQLGPLERHRRRAYR